MLINRDNYETLFLLYVDNELSAEERRVVEEFVLANPDLGEELEVLQSMVLPSEDAIFVPKTQLYKNATPVESVQESLLLMLDNELAEQYKPALLHQIDQSRDVKEEWSLLKQTVLDKNDRVVFQDKKSLYRQTSRVVPMKIWRVAAAVLIGLGIFAGINLYNDNNTSDGLSVQTTPGIKAINQTVANTNTKPLVERDELVAAEDQTPQPQVRMVNNVHSVSLQKKQQTNENVQDIPGEENVDFKASTVGESMLARLENVVEKKTVQPVNNNDEIVVTESPVKSEISNSLIDDSDVGKTRNTFARLALNNEDPDRFLNIEEDKVTRTKLGGIIRQVKRVVERNAKIKTSNGLRIGGFEIAIK